MEIISAEESKLTYKGKLLVEVEQGKYKIEEDEREFSVLDIINALGNKVMLALQANDPVLGCRNKVTNDIELLLKSKDMINDPVERLKLFHE